MRQGLEAVSAVFALLFVTQTAVFIYLYRRALTRRDVTTGSGNHTKSQAEQVGEKPIQDVQPMQTDRPMLHQSALAALELIRERGSVISIDVSRSLNLSREHTARLMKNLYTMGLVERSGKPFKYTLTEKGFSMITNKKDNVN